MRLGLGLLGLALTSIACSAGPDGRADASDVAVDASFDAPRDVTAVDATDATGIVDITFATDTPHGAPACLRNMFVDALAQCIDTPRAPSACLATVTASASAPLCDDDRDGLADDLEDALARAYSLAFAFNAGDGTRTGGDPETHWPDNLTHYTAGSHLIYRVDNDNSTERLVDASPTLDSLAGAHIDINGTPYVASDPAATQGSNFWLCLDQPGGNYPSGALVATMDESRMLPEGIDVASVVHPAGGVSSHSYAFVSTLLYYAYNEHSTVDNHEGDWEGGAVLVDLDQGNVAAVFFDRHDSVDNVRLLSLAGASPSRVIDPASESTFGNVCDESDAARARGVRFWDYAGARHHAVAYVATGGHSAYPYPGNTKLTGAGCFELSIVRDTHNGNGARLLPWLNAYAPGWTTSTVRDVVHGVRFRNVGEVTAPRESWAAFRGQWGCTQATIAKSWPGPFGNQRHCRAWVTTDGWGDAPFTTPTTGCP